MRIALIGLFEARQDEGMRKLCAQIAAATSERHETLTIDTREFGQGRARARLRDFQPDLLHYLTGPTWRSLSALRIHQVFLPGRPATVATGLRPFFSPVSRQMLPWLRPDVYLGQAERWTTLFARAGTHTRAFPNGTDLSRFRPVRDMERVRLRQRFRLAEDKPVVLHVGHVKPNRNLAALLAAQRCGRYQVWVVGSESESRPGPWREELTSVGVRVDSTYFPRIEEVYQAADIYVFTVRATPRGEFPRSYNEVGVIDLPLSVLEARGCGLPVVSTRHDALERFLAQDAGMAWFDGTADDCLAQLDAVQTAGRTPGRLDDSFDLRHLPDRLDAIYREACELKR